MSPLKRSRAGRPRRNLLTVQLSIRHDLPDASPSTDDRFHTGELVVQQSVLRTSRDHWNGARGNHRRVSALAGISGSIGEKPGKGDYRKHLGRGRSTLYSMKGRVKETPSRVYALTGCGLSQWSATLDRERLLRPENTASPSSFWG